MPPRWPQADESAPLLASSPPAAKSRSSSAQRRPRGAPSRPNAPPLGTKRFPFHPRAHTTPRWRRLLLHLFDGHRQIEALEDEDVWPLEPALQARHAASDVQRALPATLGRWRLLWAMAAVNRTRLLWMSAWNVLAVALGLIRPLLLLQLCRAGSSSLDGSSSEPRLFGTDIGVIGPVAGIFVAELALSLATAHSHHNAVRVSLHVSQSLSKMITDKMIVPHQPHFEDQAYPVSGHKEQFVQVTSRLFNDVQTIFHFTIAAREQCVIVARLAVSIAVLISIIDISWTIVGVAVVLYAVVLGFQATVGQWLMVKVETLHVSWLKTLYDSLKSIEMAKLSAWEDKLQSKIERMRSEERRMTIGFQTFWLFRYRLLLETPMLLAVLTLSSESASMTPARAFTALVLFCDCRVNAANLVPGVLVMVGGVSAWRHVEAFLAPSSQETKPTIPTTFSSSSTYLTRQYLTKMEGVCISSASRPVSSPALLLDVHWTLRQGDLVIVHGPAGIGKSTLLAALRGDHTAARVSLGSFEGLPSDCRIAYCSQDPWLQTLSIRDNILFGTPFDEPKYWAVVNACGLLEDLATLPAGDSTAVGPRGINLSSGQSARIALARACYADADLYLLDCPLANVDAVVQSEIFRKCIVELLMFKTVVIVTHNPEYIGSSYVDQLVEVKPFTVGVTSRSSVKNQAKATPGSSIRVTRRTRDYQHEFSGKTDLATSLRIRTLSREAQELRAQIESTALSTSPQRVQPSECSEVAVSWATLNEHLFDGGKTTLVWLLAAVVLYILWMVASVTKDVWILVWATTALGAHASERVDNKMARWYGYLVLASIAFAVAAAMCVFAFSAASVDRLFRRTTHALLHATMTFYYETRTGEIVSRYQRDMELVDNSLPVHVNFLALSVVDFVGRAVVFGWVLGPIGVTVTILGYGVLLRCIALRFYQQLTRSTIRAQEEQLSFLSETLDGEAVLRAFGNDRIAGLMEDLEHIHERLFRVTYMNDVFHCHAILRADTAMVLLVCALLAILAVYPVTHVELMLVLFYLLTMSEDLVPRFVAGYASTWDGFYNVERLRQFRGMPTEVDTMPSDVRVYSSGSWAPHGELTFENVSFEYTQPSPTKATTMALRDVSFCIHGGEKIGIVGRTGSGKSSLAMALLRIHPLRSGRILLDGVDLRTVPLTQLRRSFTMIPQSPTFYRCSIRDYLDPFHEYDDARLWRELLTVDLGARVQSLDEELLDNGENWSLGQRQLLCFARALLKPSRVVVLDEAFSCVDQSCQEKILRILRERFASSTVILITHRLDQILEFDRILVMCDGRLVESGSASELASDASSVFYEFLETSLLTF